VVQLVICFRAETLVALMKIPFNRPSQVGAEIDYIRDAIGRSKLSGDGHFTSACQSEISRLAGGGDCLLTHSCTAALEMSMLLADLSPGDEVILPSFTFVSTANAVVLRGATPVFIDIRPDTLNLDETQLEAAISKRTRAIMAVHYAGVPAEMDALNSIAAHHRLVVVEDAAQAIGSRYRGRPAGSLGAMAAFSFHETKNVISGEGGALVVNDRQFIERAEIIREKGTNRRQFLNGFVDKYTWVDIGSSYLPSELVAAYLFGQLEQFTAIQDDRMKSWNAYAGAFTGLSELGFGLPQCPTHCEHNGHIFYLIAPDAATRDTLIARMKADNIDTPFHYVPLHDAPLGRKLGRSIGSLPVTTDLSARLLRLPLYYGVGDETERVVERVWHHAREVTK
jgi:dTDP-4-amino-4,6-dideoxygalactose transaminase